MDYTQVSHYLDIAAQVIAASAIIAAAVPTHNFPSAFVAINKIINILAFNFGNAKNAEKSKDK